MKLGMDEWACVIALWASWRAKPKLKGRRVGNPSRVRLRIEPRNMRWVAPRVSGFLLQSHKTSTMFAFSLAQRPFASEELA